MRGAFVAAMLLATGCGDARVAPSPVASVVLVTEGAPMEAGSPRLRLEALSAVARDDAPRIGGRVAAAARQILADLRLGGDAPVPPGSGSVQASSRDLDRIQRHVAEVWHVDPDPAVVDVLRVWLRAALATDGSVRAVELLDCHGGPEDVLARFVEEAIAALDWSSPLPVGDATVQTRTLDFRFEASRARR